MRAPSRGREATGDGDGRRYWQKPGSRPDAQIPEQQLDPELQAEPGTRQGSKHWAPPQESQQLRQLPTVPLFAVQCSASFLVLHTGAPFFVTQQVTKPSFPHVDLAAHFLTFPLQLLGRKFGSIGSSPASVLAMSAAHLTYVPWSGAFAQSHWLATWVRAF